MMKKIIILIALIILFSIYINFFRNPKISNTTPEIINSALPTTKGKPAENGSVSRILAAGLDTPWALSFLPDNNILVTEREGRVRLIEDGKLQNVPVATIASVKEIGEGGLLGIALDPDFSGNNFVYLYYTYRENGGNTLNRIVRMEYRNKKLISEIILLDAIPGASNHNGGRLKFGPDKFLYATTGDGQVPSRSQDKNSLAGKILRLTTDGKQAPGNPFNSPVYSYGHRNSQGLAWDGNGNLWATEHGRSGLQSGLDEVNRIVPGKNYGWPDIQGDEQKDGMERPIVQSGSDTWAPGGAAFEDGALYFTGLRGSALYRLNQNSAEVEEFFKGEFGRLRDVVLGPDNLLYVTTSNLDGRGTPKQDDDKIIIINPQLF